jgi:hypothetical protein
MEKMRIILAIIFSLCANIIVKLIVLYIEDVIKKTFKKNKEKIINIVKLFYPIFSLSFIFSLAKGYPAILLDKYQYSLNALFYAGVILSIYHWLFKPIFKKIISIIENYHIKKG